jgi:ParB family chromosome partitioning protein
MSSKKDQPYTSKLRGVSALLGEVSPPASPHILPIESISLPPQQPRRYFPEDAQQQLVDSIRQHGVLEPILVRPLGLEGRQGSEATSEQRPYELVAGERRYRAAICANLTEIPVTIKELNDREAKAIALIENLQRVDLNPIEETEGILSLLALNLEKYSSKTIELLYRMENERKGKVTQNVLGNSESERVIEVFKNLGTISWSSFVSSRLPLLNLPPEILEALRTGAIEYTKAQLIARLKNSEIRGILLEETIKQRLSIAQLKEKIKALTFENQPPNLKQKFKEAYSRLNNSKCWENPKKQKQLEKLLLQIESLLKEK